MELLGIDFGTSRFRVATGSGGSIAVRLHRLSSQRLPFVIESTAPFRITALKRLLDFDRSLPVPPSGMNSMALLAEIFRAALGDCCPDGWSDQYAVVTVPPCVSQRQRSALRKVAIDVGLTRIKLVDDTYAALLASWEHVRAYNTILVYSWGAGVFAAGMYCKNGNAYQLVAQEGDRQLGGDDFDAVLAGDIVAALGQLGNGCVPSTADDFMRIVNIAEELRRRGTTDRGILVPLRVLLAGAYDESTDLKISTESLYEAIGQSIESTIGLAFKAANATPGAKPEAILAVGGLTIAPAVRKALQRSFEMPIIQAPEDAVAIGSVLFGQRLPPSEWSPEHQTGGGLRITVPGRPQPKSAAVAQTPGQAAAQPEHEKWADNFLPFIERAQTEYENGRLAGSIAAFDELMNGLWKFKGDLYCKAAAALCAQGSAAQALSLLREGNQQDPRNRFIAVDFAQACYREALQARSAQKPQITVELATEGAASLRRLPQTEPNTAVLLAGLLHLQGIGHWDQGKLGLAVPMIAESVTMDPKNEGYKKNLDLVRKMLKNLGPNDPCPCRSGLKYKKCCGRTR